MSRVFDSLCPVESSRSRKRLCVVLFTRESTEHEAYRQNMRTFILQHNFSPVGNIRPRLLTLDYEPGTVPVQNYAHPYPDAAVHKSDVYGIIYNSIEEMKTLPFLCQLRN